MNEDNERNEQETIVPESGAETDDRTEELEQLRAAAAARAPQAAALIVERVLGHGDR